jgi:hypothetical protein
MVLRPSLIAGVLLSLLACNPATSGQQAPAPAAPPRMSFSQEFVERTVREASEALARGAGVRLVKPVPAVLLTAAQARERRQAFAASLPEGAGVTAGMDLLADFMFSDTMLGRYLPDEKVLYVVDDVLRRYAPDERSARELLFAVVAHELTHAQDDQLYGIFPDPVKLLPKFADGDLSGLPSLQVTMSLLEGHATYASELACKSAGVRPLPAPTMEDVRDSQHFDGGDNPLLEGLAGLGNAVARLKLVQYVQGRAFCQQAVSFGGEAFMKEVFTHLPLSADELADFNRFKVRWAAQKDAEEEAAPAPVKPGA